MRQVKLLNIDIHNITMIEMLDKMRFGGVVFTPNVDHLIRLQKDQEFYSAYQISDYRVCDSQFLLYASSFLGTPLQEKLSGSDLFPAFYTYYKHDRNVTVFLLGASPGVAKQAQRKINSKVGRDIITASHSPTFGFEKDEEECQKIVDLINKSGATVLAIGVGAPKQELWIAKYKDQLRNVNLFLAIGATIDFEAGNVQRSPKWMSQVGLEWLYRTLCEPKRLWKRYIIDDLPFFWLVAKQRLNLYQNPWLCEEPPPINQHRSPVGAIRHQKLKRS